MQRRDHRLRQIRSRRACGHLQALQPAGDSAAVPLATVLLVQRQQCAVGVHPGAPPGIMQQHKGRQRVGVTRVGHQRAQFTGQPDPLIA